jgi:hypothetical protein
MDASRKEEKLNIYSPPPPRHAIFLKIKTEERKETANIPESCKLAKALLNGLNVLVNKFTYLLGGGGIFTAN